MFDVPGQIRKAIGDLLVWVAQSGLKPVMDVLGRTALSTPDLTGSEHVKAIWTTSLVAANGVYVLFIIAGCFIIASRETLQSQYGFKQIAPRLVLAAVLSNVSLILCGKGIDAANALTAAIAGQGVDGPTAANAIVGIVDQPLTGGPGNILLALLVIAVVVLGLVVVITFLLRVALLVVLIGVAPWVLIFHATPQTEGIAYTWWRALAACFGLQFGQAIIVVATVKVFLTPHGLVLLGVPATASGLLGMLVCVTMLWLLIKLPGLMKQFVLAPLGLRSQGRGLVGQLLQAYVMLKTLGAAAGVIGGGSRAARPATAARQRAAATAGNGPPTSTARPISSPGGRPGNRRPAPSRPSPPAPVAFSNAPIMQTPLAAPAGTAGAPAFSNAPQPITPTAAPTGPASAAHFSHPNPAQPPTQPSGRPAPAAFSNTTPTSTSSTRVRPLPAATFSNPAKPQSAPRRPPAPVTPVFSSAPPTPKTRPTAAQRPSAAPRTTASRATDSRTAATRSGPPPVTTTPATATPRAAPSPSPAARPSPSPSPPPSPPSRPAAAPSPPPVRRRHRGGN
ncbi:hypothetical protein [Actinoplanes sp. GCM10030250]|uniref:hypothetical protein n=1 Tax=Actinoplanes sp. GCM10030250 TaxID=3273376 RepID=UPI00360910EF